MTFNLDCSTRASRFISIKLVHLHLETAKECTTIQNNMSKTSTVITSAVSANHSHVRVFANLAWSLFCICVCLSVCLIFYFLFCIGFDFFALHITVEYQHKTVKTIPHHAKGMSFFGNKGLPRFLMSCHFMTHRSCALL